VPEIVDHINNSCPSLSFKGLMGMGKVGDLDGFR
jgi:hypothetical protein